MHHLDLDVLLENYIQHDNEKKGRILEESIFLRFEQLRIILMITRSTHGMRRRNISGAERQNMHQEGRKKQFDEGFKVARKQLP